MFEEQDAPENGNEIDCTTCKMHIHGFVLSKEPKSVGVFHICKATASLIKVKDVKKGYCDLYVRNDDNASNTHE